MIIKRYCQMSTKYLLYSFQKLFRELNIFILVLGVFIFNLNIKSQMNDSLALKFKNLKVIIIPQETTLNEWSFEEIEEDITTHKKNKLLNLTFSLGWLSLQTQPTFKKNETFNIIPYNKLNSNAQTITYYFKHFELFKSVLHLSIGGGFKVQRLNLGFNKTLISPDSISFEKDLEFENNRNVLKYRYWCIPISISFSNNKKTVVQIQLNNNLLHNGKLDVFNTENFREITKSTFFQKKYYPSIKAKLILGNFGLFAESSLISSSTIFDNQHNFSCGIIFCNFR